MKTNLVTIAAIFVFGLLFIRLMPSIPTSSTVTQKQDFLTVSGEGKVTTVPDTAIVDLGVNLNKPTVKAAQTDANTIIKNITDEVKKLGVEDKDIKTSNYSVFPQYDYSTGATGRITGYQVNVNLTLTIRDIEKVNNVIEMATSKGANNVSGIQLTVNETKQKELRQQARDMAVKEAKTKAESLASAAGISLGKIVNIQEADQNNIVPMFARSAMNEKIAAGGDASNQAQIEPGSADISSSVTLYYETR